MAGEIDIRIFDTGQYPTEPLDAHDDTPVPGFYDYWKIAGMRLANHVPHPYLIDPALKLNSYGTSMSDTGLPDFMGKEAELTAIAKRNKMLFGFRTSASSVLYSTPSYYEWPETKSAWGPSTSLAIAVSQYVDDAHAQKAADEFFRADRDRFKDNEEVELPKHSAALSHWKPGGTALRSFTARGSYVVSITVVMPTSDLNGLKGLADKAFEKQLSMLDTLPPITDEGMLELPWDPERMLRRTLNPNQFHSPTVDEDYGVFEPDGFLHFTEDAGATKTFLDRLGADRVASSYGTLSFRVADPEAAQRAVEEKVTAYPFSRVLDPPKDVPDTACVEVADPGGSAEFMCIVAYDRYVGYVGSNQITDVHQRAAAQYALFANSR